MASGVRGCLETGHPYDADETSSATLDERGPAVVARCAAGVSQDHATGDCDVRAAQPRERLVSNLIPAMICTGAIGRAPKGRRLTMGLALVRLEPVA